MINATLRLLEGFAQNAIIFAVTLILSLPLGVLIAFGEMARPTRALARGLVCLIRGTPLMLQLFIVLYVPGLIFGTPFRGRLTAALIAFVINYAAYFAEIFRGAIENVPCQQFEAAADLGCNKYTMYTKIIFPQALSMAIPPLGNEVITLVKDTSLARVIAIPEIVMNAAEFTSQGLIWPLFYTGAFFLAATTLITKAFSLLEKNFQIKF